MNFFFLPSLRKIVSVKPADKNRTLLSQHRASETAERGADHYGPLPLCRFLCADVQRASTARSNATEAILRKPYFN